MDNRSDFLDFAINTAKKAGKLQMKYFGNISSIKKKSTNIDLLTDADKESESFIINQIKSYYPTHSILSEEYGQTDNHSKYRWIIDPLDGTTNFVHKLPIFSVSMGLKKNNQTICAVVYNPAANKCFYAEIGKGSFLNDEKIKCSVNSSLSESLLVTGFPYLHDKKYDLSFEIFKKFYDRTRGLRRLGAASLDLCFIAMGRFDGFYEFALEPWDICAGVLIAQEAGAQVSDWNNAIWPESGERILATNGYIHKEMVKILSNKIYKIFY